MSRAFDFDSAVARLSVASACAESRLHPAILGDGFALDFAEVSARLDDRVASGHGILCRVMRPDLDSVLALLAALEGRHAIAAIHPRWTEDEIRRRLAALDIRQDAPIVSSRDLALIVFSSGSAGAGKPIAISRAALAACAAIGLGRLDFGAGDRWMLGLPPAHVSGASIVARCLAARATVVVHSAPFEPVDFVEAIERFAVTHVSVVPTMLKRLVEVGVRSPRSLRKLVVGGAACPDSLAAQALDAGFPVVRTYGMSETCAMVTCESQPLEGGVGRPLDHVEIGVVDGELRIWSPTLASGIWPDVSLDFDDEGRLRTHDAGSIDSAGCLHVAGRLDDVIVTGGENVHPAEIEAGLLAVEGVEDAVVFGEPDEAWGARVAAAIVLGAGFDAASVDAVARSRFASFARPRRYVVFEAFPTLPSGKIDRRSVIAVATRDRSD